MLDNMIHRPAMYFFNRPGYIREIVAFDFGFSTHSGYEPELHSFKESFLPDDFVNILKDKFEGDGPWWIAMERAIPDEAEAWKKFTSLWAEYRGCEFPPERPGSQSIT